MENYPFYRFVAVIAYIITFLIFEAQTSQEKKDYNGIIYNEYYFSYNALYSAKV